MGKYGAKIQSKRSAGRWLSLAGALIALFAVPTFAFAQSGEVIEGDLTLTTGKHVIDSDTIVDGDILLLGGTLTLDGDVEGNLVVLGGSAFVDGEIDGDLILMGGNLELGDMADFSGECAIIGGSWSDEAGRESSCTNVLPSSAFNSVPGMAELNLDQFPVEVPPIPEIPSVGGDSGQNMGIFGRFLLIIFQSVAFGFIAFVMGTLIPHRLTEVSEAVERKPQTVAVVGVLTFVATISLLTITSIVWVPVLFVLAFICGLGIILGAAGLLFLGGTGFMGWTAVGALVGERLAGSLKIDRPSYPALAAVGTATLTFGVGMLGLIPWFPYFLIGFLVLSIGLGGVVLTRLGRQPYPHIDFTADPGKVQEAINNMP